MDIEESLTLLEMFNERPNERSNLMKGHFFLGKNCASSEEAIAIEQDQSNLENISFSH